MLILSLVSTSKKNFYKFKPPKGGFFMTVICLAILWLIDILVLCNRKVMAPLNGALCASSISVPTAKPCSSSCIANCISVGNVLMYAGWLLDNSSAVITVDSV